MPKKLDVPLMKQKNLSIHFECPACGLQMIFAEEKWQEFRSLFDHLCCPICLEELWDKAEKLSK